MQPTALDGVRILDLTHYIAGPYCTKLLADYGADVVKIERPPAGDPARQLGPFFQDDPHPEKSGLFLHLNTNKRSALLDLRGGRGRETFWRLLEQSDVVVENFRPGVMASLGIDYAALRARRPGIVLTSISNFGQTGPYRDLRGSELIEYAMGGSMNTTGHRSREPLKLAANVVQYHAGAVAAYATMLALLRVEADGPGEHVDVSIYETQAASRDRRTIHLTAHAYTGETATRPQSSTRFAIGVRPCADGYVSLVGGWNRLDNFLQMIGREDLAGDERLKGPRTAANEDLVEEVEHSYLLWLMQRGKREAVAEAQAQRILSAPINTTADLLEDPHFRQRGVWETIDHPATGPVEYPGRPFILSATPRNPARPAPLLGEHTAEILREAGVSEEEVVRLRRQGAI